jgi:YfiH family protein
MSVPMDKIIASGSEPPAAAGGSANDSEQQILTESGFYWRERGGVKVLVCKPLDDAGFANGFSTRLGGVSNITGAGDIDLNLAGFDDDTAENIHENRRRFLSIFAGEYRLATAWQVHGNGVKVVTEANLADSEERFDALTSNLERVLIGVKTADCVPILLGDPVTGSYAAIHAGWRGTVSSVAAKAIDTMQRHFGTDPADLIAAIGPAAGCERYERGADVISAFEDKFKKIDKYLKPTRPGHALIDLHAANSDQLSAAGVSTKNIFLAPFCTMERPDLFFSYRLEKSRHGKTGRLMSVIGKASG